jgi:hypothetical protein
MSPALRIARLAGAFLSGQSVIQLANFCAGLLLVRLLPLDQYALYTVAGALLAFAAAGTTLGVPQALITRGSTVHSDSARLGALIRAASPQCRAQYLVTVPAIVALSWAMFHGHQWSWPAKAVSVSLVLLGGWLRLPTMLASAVLNLRHDARGLFRIGIGEALARVALVPLCIVWPYAPVALFANVVGSALARWAAQARVHPLLDRTASADPADSAAIRAFTRPLIPNILYFALQGQLSVLVLSAFGSATSIAQVGAISRFNQLITLAMMLNPFLVQPVLARQSSRRRFLERLAVIIGAIAGASAIVLLSAALTPRWWLLILGPTYNGLERELLIALGTSLATLAGGTLYTAVISRSQTGGQFWAIILGIAAQLIFGVTHELSTAANALVLSLIPAVAYGAVQGVLLMRVVLRWSPTAPASMVTAGWPLPAIEIESPEAPSGLPGDLRVTPR